MRVRPSNFEMDTLQDADMHDERFEFTLPRVNIGLPDDSTIHPPGAPFGSPGSQFVRDIVPFSVGSATWQLRQLVLYSDNFLPADTACHRASRERGKLDCRSQAKHAILQVPTASINQSDAEDIASDLGWLLGLAFGQRVTWNQLGIRRNHQWQLLKGRSVSLPERSSGAQPLANGGEGELKGFIETAYSIYSNDRGWWKFTLHWFALACEISTVEVSAMIFSMLLDRVSSKILEGYDFGKLIGTDLAACLSSKECKNALQRNLTSLLQQSAAGWTDERSINLLNTIRDWNDKPSYPKKITTAFARLGLVPPPKSVLNARHTLMHGGQLPTPQAADISNYHYDIHQSIVLLLFSMLGYKESIFLLGRGIRPMTEFSLPKTSAE